jgi:hypothetical protein
VDVNENENVNANGNVNMNMNMAMCANVTAMDEDRAGPCLRLRVGREVVLGYLGADEEDGAGGFAQPIVGGADAARGELGRARHEGQVGLHHSRLQAGEETGQMPLEIPLLYLPCNPSAFHHWCITFKKINKIIYTTSGCYLFLCFCTW